MLIRADAGPGIGTGHVMRGLALAQAAHDMGYEVRMAGHVGVPWVCDRLKREDMAFTVLPGAAEPAEDPRQLLALANDFKPDWLVTDGYHFTADCHKTVMAAGYRLLCIDDYNHLPEYQADILLNQNIGAEKLAYRGRFGRRLNGSDYALLRREFTEARTLGEKRQLPDRPRNILISLGGGDVHVHLEKILPLINPAQMNGCRLRVIAGNSTVDQIIKCFGRCPARVEVLERVEDMPDLLLWADLCLSAAGSTCWELCCLGTPFAAVSVVENQVLVEKFLRQAGLSLPLNDKWPDHEDLSRACEQGLAFIDGLGAHRVVAAMSKTGSGTSLTV
jgi:UDP-2,4-diacetamido-2,4,6-trideoxy-beta-L-altropyranose hydrolase